MRTLRKKNPHALWCAHHPFGEYLNVIKGMVVPGPSRHRSTQVRRTVGSV